MSARLVGIDSDKMELFTDVLSARDPRLLASVLESQAPTRAQREAIESHLGRELIANIGQDSNLNERAEAVYVLIEQFLTQFPIEPDDG